MTHILSLANAGVILEIARARMLLGFDFDGTLAPLVASREAAVMRPSTRRLFARVCELYPCAVISGRRRKDVRARLGSARVRYVVGNHGLEGSLRPAGLEVDVARARRTLEEALAGVPAVDLEDKRYSLSVHYRTRASKAATLQAAALLPETIRIVPGKQVVNVIPARGPTKGDALLELQRLARADSALYVGDDVTDEDVFALGDAGRILGVRVGRSRSSAASYFLRDQLEVDRLLGRLVSLKEGRLPRGGRRG